jgi:hypothetical protein
MQATFVSADRQGIVHQNSEHRADRGFSGGLIVATSPIILCRRENAVVEVVESSQLGPHTQRRRYRDLRFTGRYTASGCRCPRTENGVALPVKPTSKWLTAYGSRLNVSVPLRSAALLPASKLQRQFVVPPSSLQRGRNPPPPCRIHSAQIVLKKRPSEENKPPPP